MTRFTYHPKNKVIRASNTNMINKDNLNLCFMTNTAQIGDRNSSFPPYPYPSPRIAPRHPNKLQKDNTKAVKAKTGVYICLPPLFPSHSLFHSVTSLPTTLLKPFQSSSPASPILQDAGVIPLSTLNTVDHFPLEIISFCGFSNITVSLASSAFIN